MPQVFKAASSKKVLHQISIIANEEVSAKIGDTITTTMGIIFTANSLTGIGPLTLPYAFHEAGWLLGTVILSVCMVVAYVTATFVIEALATGNSLHYEKTAAGAIDTVSGIEEPLLHDELSEEKKTALADGISPFRLSRHDTRQSFVHEVRRFSADSAFKIRERIEVGAMGEEMMDKKWTTQAIYAVILVYVYGSLSAFVVTVNSAIANTVSSGCSRAGVEVSPDVVYPWSLVLAFVFTCKLCFGDLQKTKQFTIFVTILRMSCMALMVLIALPRIVGRTQREGVQVVFDGLPVWQPAGFGAVFGNSVYGFGLHHVLPSMVAPLRDQIRAPFVVLISFLFVLAVEWTLSITALLAWADEQAAHCGEMPGSPYCTVQPFYNQNFGPLPWAGGIVGFFILSYPAFAIATIPANAITCRNTLGRFLGAPPPDPDNPWTTSNVALTLAILIPPFTIAGITKDIQMIVKYVGGYLGITVSYLLPIVLVIRSRRMLDLDDDEKDLNWPLKSPFARPIGYAMVLMFYLGSFGMVTKQLFFS